MNPGLLHRRIRIEVRSQTRDSYGDAVDSWSALTGAASLPARLILRGGGEGFGNVDQRVATKTSVFRVRYSNTVAAMDPAQHRIVYAGKTYDIRSVEEIGRREYLDLVAEYRSTF